jgi:prepilin-type N-terminal cleavage/methylation domain-containing protein
VSSISLIKIREDKGVTLVELMIALMMSSILIAALYRTFIGQQRTYTVQEQVVDMQQNVTVSIHRMMSEIRMAGFGNVNNALGLSGGVNGFTQVITPNNNTLTIVGGFKQVKRDNGDPILINSVGKDPTGKNTLTLNYATDNFDGAKHHFISIGGLESNTVAFRSGSVLTLSLPLTLIPRASTPIFKIQALTYDLGISDGKNVLRRNENTGGYPQPLAENIENVQFEYFDANGNPTGIPSNIRMVRVTVTARTDMKDPEFTEGDGYRRRQIASNIYIRNMGSYF